MKHLLFLFVFAACGGTPQPQTPAVESTGTILGTWQGCDERTVVFTEESGEVVGRYEQLGKLAEFGFAANEIGYRYAPSSSGTYEGQVLWKWTDGRTKWKPSRAVVTGNQFTDSGGDSCSKMMTRVTP